MCNKKADAGTIDCFFWCGQSAFNDAPERIPDTRPDRLSALSQLRCGAPLPEETEGNVILPLCASDGQECALKNAMSNRWNC